MKKFNANISLLSLICIVTIVALCLALADAKSDITALQSQHSVDQDKIKAYRERLGEHAPDSNTEFSICQFYDPYSPGMELRWRIKSPDDSQYRVMYSTSNPPKSGIPIAGREIASRNAEEFVLAVTFAESELQISGTPESTDGSQIGPRQQTNLPGRAWLECARDPHTKMLYPSFKPIQFQLEKPFRILSLEGKARRLTVWVEQRGITKR